MARRYDLEKMIDLPKDTKKEIFTAEVYEIGPDNFRDSFTNKTIKGLAKEVCKKFTLETKDLVTTSSHGKIRDRVAYFPVSDSELINFYQEFQESCKEFLRYQKAKKED